jgi:hypothetical protein
MQFTDLPLDIVDHILSCIPDYRTLLAAILTSKAQLYKVFQSHKQSILVSVTFNLVGPSLPHAVAAAFFTVLKHQEVRNAEFDERMATTKNRLLFLSRKSFAFLESSIPIMDKLEDIFSQMYAFHKPFFPLYTRDNSIVRCKDRRSTKSVLTYVESLRFRRALYRIWLLTMNLFDVSMSVYDDILDPNSDVDNLSAGQKVNRAVIQYMTARLQQFNKEELIQFVAVINYLTMLRLRLTEANDFTYQGMPSVLCPLPVRRTSAQCVAPPALDMFHNYILSPAHMHHWVLLNKMPYFSEDQRTDGIYLPNFHHALSLVCPSKKLDTNSTIATAAESILDSIVGEDDACECVCKRSPLCYSENCCL